MLKYIIGFKRMHKKKELHTFNDLKVRNGKILFEQVSNFRRFFNFHLYINFQRKLKKDKRRNK